MAENMNATCSICGKKYHLCLSCKDSIELTPWKKHTDTSEHYKIYQILHGFSIGLYNKEEANERLKTVDLSDLESLRDNIKAVIKDIMVAKEEVETKDETVVINETEKVSDLKELPAEVKETEESFSIKTRNTYRRKTSKIVETE